MLRKSLCLAIVLAAVAACSNDTPTTSNDSTLDPAENAAITSDAATIAADGFSQDVDVMLGMDGSIGNTDALIEGGADLVGPGGWRPGLTGCSFAGGMFTCPDTLRNGLDVSREITFLDQNGESQSGYDSLTTASIHVIADVSGDVTHGPWSATVARHRDFTFTGLLGDETTRTVNGTGNETVTRSRVTRNDSTRTYDVVGHSQATDVVMPVGPHGGNQWPVSGTITRTDTLTLTSGKHAGRTVVRTVTITFDGSEDATASVDGTQFTVDLATSTASMH